MAEYRHGGHTLTNLSVHIVWCTKYRYKVLSGDIQYRCRDLLRQVCDSEDVKILKGVVSRDHIHLHVEYPASLSISELVRRLKGRSGRKLLEEFPELKRRYWGGHLWAVGYGAWSTGVITDEMVQHYLEHHEAGSENDDVSWIME